MLSAEQRTVRMRFKKLTRAERHRFPLRGERLEAPNLRGVYVIYSPKGKVMHVGGTPRGKNGIRQRLQNHLDGLSSFVGKSLGGKGSKLRNGYEFSSLKVENSRLRALLEHYAAGMLCPKHIGLGESIKRLPRRK